MTLEALFKIAESGGTDPEPGTFDKREALLYMDVQSDEYRKQAAKLRTKPAR